MAPEECQAAEFSGCIPTQKLAGGTAAGTARSAMQDVAMVLFTVIFFALAFLYVKACQKLR
jgi:hypothetical protein